MSKSKNPSTPKRPEITGKDAWAALAIHRVTLFSGAVVKIRIPDLTLLVAGGALPEGLRSVALEQMTAALRDTREADAIAGVKQDPADTPAGLDQEQLAQLAQLHRWLICQTLVEPSFTPEELEEVMAGENPLPAPDLQMLTEFASRERNLDARGVYIGVEPVDRYEVWRSLHGCEEDCEACNGTARTFSSSG